MLHSLSDFSLANAHASPPLLKKTSLVNESIPVGFSTARSRDKTRGTCVTRVCNKTELQYRTGKKERRDGVVSCIRDKCTGSTQRGQWKSTRKCKSKKAHHFSVEKNCCCSLASTHMVWYVHTSDTLVSLAHYCANGGTFVGHSSLT